MLKEIEMYIEKNGKQELFTKGKGALISLLNYSVDFALYGKKINYNMKVIKNYYENGQNYIDVEIIHNDEIGKKVNLKYIYKNVKASCGRIETSYINNMLLENEKQRELEHNVYNAIKIYYEDLNDLCKRLQDDFEGVGDERECF